MAESNATQVILTDDGLKIIKAQNTADNAAGGVADLNDPNLMSVIEKQNNIGQFAGLTSQYNVLVQNSKDDGINTTAVTTAYNNLNQFMAGVLADPDHASDIDRVRYKKYQDAYNEELAKLQNALQNSANNKFTSAASATRQAATVASQAFSEAQSAFNVASYTASDFVTVKQKADNAVTAAENAQKNANSAVAKAESTASGFGKVSQKADSAFANAMSAQNDASSAIAKASSAAVDSKDAKQIAGAVSQSYKTLTDGSTMTIAELQNGLGAKLTKSDLDGYSTQTWTQNQIKLTADGIKDTMSSIKSTVDGHVTSINDLQADSREFKAQFETFNDTLGKHTKDIGTLQTTSKELSSNFSSLDSDNKTNKQHISELKQNAKEVSSTLENVQTQVQNSAVGTNLLLKTYSPFSMNGNNTVNQAQRMYDLSRKIESGTTVTLSFDAVSTAPESFNMRSDGGDGGTWASFIERDTVDTTKKHYVVTTTVYGFSDLGINMRLDNVPSTVTITVSNMKLELGSHATDYSTNPLDNATVTAVSKISQTVDGFKTDISKKIEQKDLNGYATQDWTNNKIKTTADGINGTISSVKGTVDGHTTSINDLQADSRGFKAQFTTYKDTVDRHDKDIGKIQADAKSLSASFDSLSSDNKTNKHNIGQLQLDSKSFSSTLATVKQQVTDFSNISQTVDSIKTAVSKKVDNDDFSTYKEQTNNLISQRVTTKDFSTYTTQTSKDINLRVKSGDLLDQINMQAGKTLVSSSKQLILSGKNILLDSDDPVIMKSANIDKLLVGKKLTAADISANTFTTNNGTFTVKQDGSITAKNMTLIGGTLTTPVINTGTINGSTINGTTFHGGDVINDANNTSKLYPTTISSNGHIYTTRFNSSDAMQTDLSTGALTTKYRNLRTTDKNNRYEAYNTTIQANQISLFAGYTDGKDSSFTRPFNTSEQAGDGYVLLNPVSGITFHGDNQQITFNGTSADVIPKGIIITPYGNINPNGTQNIWYVGNGPTMKTASFGIDGSGANNIKFNRSLDIGNFNISTYHTITSSDSGPIHFNRANGKSGDIYAATVHYESLAKVSLLSVKKDVKKADTAYWAQLVNSIDLATYQYKSDDNTSHLRLSSIVDDVNDTKQWQLPDVFISRDEDGKLCGVDDSVLLNATLATVQEQQKEIDQLNGHNMELEARLNKLEAKLNG